MPLYFQLLVFFLENILSVYSDSVPSFDFPEPVSPMYSSWQLEHICSYFKSLKFFRTAILERMRNHFVKIAHKVAKSKYFSNV